MIFEVNNTARGALARLAREGATPANVAAVNAAIPPGLDSSGGPIDFITTTTTYTQIGGGEDWCDSWIDADGDLCNHGGIKVRPEWWALVLKREADLWLQNTRANLTTAIEGVFEDLNMGRATAADTKTEVERLLAAVGIEGAAAPHMEIDQGFGLEIFTISTAPGAPWAVSFGGGEPKAHGGADLSTVEAARVFMATLKAIHLAPEPAAAP